MPASYPISIKSFLTYQDRPGLNNIVTDPDHPGQTVDLTIDRARITNEIHDEVAAVEKTMGVTGIPFTVVPGTRSMADEISYLYNNKSAGQPDPNNNAIYPMPPPSHNHTHVELSGLGADVHPQYIRVDGARAFTAPVTAPNATAGSHLATLAQATHSGYLTGPQVTSAVQAEINEDFADRGIVFHSVKGPAPQRYRMTGGHFYGPTDTNGNIYIDFSRARFAGLLTFVYMKNIFPGGSAYGYIYQYQEDQLILLSLSNQGAWIQFIEDIIVDKQAAVAMSWMAVGV